MSNVYAIRRKPCPAIILSQHEAVAEAPNTTVADMHVQRPAEELGDSSQLTAEDTHMQQPTEEISDSSQLTVVDTNMPQPAEEISESSQLVGAEKDSRKTKRPSVFGLWKYELLSVLGSCLSLAAICILLRLFDDQDLAKWKGIVSINTFISIFTTLFKGAVAITLSSGIGQLKWIWFSTRARSLADLPRFDAAAVGPWGCTLLIARQFRGQRMPFAATLGAILVVLSLAVDPFSQATASVESCLRTLKEPASIPRVSIPSVYIPVNENDNTQITLGYGMQMAFLTGIYSPPANSSTSTKVACSSGNCTFHDTFTTLDLCYQCSDISEQVNRTSPNTWSLPNYNSTVTMDVWPERPDSQAQMTTSTSSTNDAGHITMGTSWFDFQVLFMGCRGNGSLQQSSSNCDNVARAYSCDFTPCVKTYTANVTKHIYAEQEVAAKRQYLYPIVHTHERAKAFQLAVNYTFYNGNWSTCTGSKDKTDENTLPIYSMDSYTQWLDPNFNPDLGEDLGLLYYRPECAFQVEWLDVSFMTSYAEGLFSDAGITSSPVASPDGPAWLQNLWNWGKVNMSAVDGFAHGIATSIGAQWRKEGNDLEGLLIDNSTKLNLGRVPGRNLELRPCIKVQWGFFSFLGVILAGEIIFFVFVVVLSLRAPWDGDWKASTVPQLLPHLHDYMEAHGETEDDLYQESKQIKAIFAPDNGRWRLKTVS